MIQDIKSPFLKVVMSMIVVAFVLFMFYVLYMMRDMTSSIMALGSLSAFFRTFYTPEQLKKRPFDVSIAAGFVILIALILVYSDSLSNLELPPITSFIRFLLVLFTGILTVFVSMMCNDLYPNFVYWISKQGAKPVSKPLRMWIVFFVLTFIAAICSAVAAVSPAR